MWRGSSQENRMAISMTQHFSARCRRTLKTWTTSCNMYRINKISLTRLLLSFWKAPQRAPTRNFVATITLPMQQPSFFCHNLAIKVMWTSIGNQLLKMRSANLSHKTSLSTKFMTRLHLPTCKVFVKADRTICKLHSSLTIYLTWRSELCWPQTVKWVPLRSKDCTRIKRSTWSTTVAFLSPSKNGSTMYKRSTKTKNGRHSLWWLCSDPSWI